MDLVLRDRSRIDTAYFSISEENLRRQIALPWMSFGSDSASTAAEGAFLKRSTHPRAYGCFARLLGKYVRDEKIISLPEAIRRITRLPADNLGLDRRGRIERGYFADIVVFDPATIADRATWAEPHQYATGVRDVIVNGAGRSARRRSHRRARRARRLRSWQARLVSTSRHRPAVPRLDRAAITSYDAEAPEDVHDSTHQHRFPTRPGRRERSSRGASPARDRDRDRSRRRPRIQRGVRICRYRIEGAARAGTAPAHRVRDEDDGRTLRDGAGGRGQVAAGRSRGRSAAGRILRRPRGDHDAAPPAHPHLRHRRGADSRGTRGRFIARPQLA